MFIHKMNLIEQNETAKYMTLFGKVHSLRSIQSFLNGFGNYPKTQKVTNNKPNLWQSSTFVVSLAPFLLHVVDAMQQNSVNK